MLPVLPEVASVVLRGLLAPPPPSSANQSCRLPTFAPLTGAPSAFRIAVAKDVAVEPVAAVSAGRGVVMRHPVAHPWVPATFPRLEARRYSHTRYPLVPSVPR